MGMLPGFSNALMPAGHEKESQAKIKRFMCIMDSMTDKELDSSEPKMLSVRVGAQETWFRSQRCADAPQHLILWGHFQAHLGRALTQGLGCSFMTWQRPLSQWTALAGEIRPSFWSLPRGVGSRQC